MSSELMNRTLMMGEDVRLRQRAECHSKVSFVRVTIAWSGLFFDSSSHNSRRKVTKDWITSDELHFATDVFHLCATLKSV